MMRKLELCFFDFAGLPGTLLAPELLSKSELKRRSLMPRASRRGAPVLQGAGSPAKRARHGKEGPGPAGLPAV
jgi:hypothetical protein